MLPKIKQQEFIKDVIVRYGCYINTDIESKRVKFDLFKNVEGKKLQSKDWTNKIDITNPINVDYKKLSSSYGVLNKFTYEQDTSERDFNEFQTPLQDYNDVQNVDELGTGSFLIDNDFVVNEKVIYNSPFGSSAEGETGKDMAADFISKIMYISYGKKIYTESGGTVDTLEYETQTIDTYRVALVIKDIPVEDLSQSTITGIRIGGDTLADGFEDSANIPFSYFVKTTKDNDTVNNTNYNLSWVRLNTYNNDTGLFDDYYEDQISILNRGDVTK